ncbi:MAG: DUF4810 domain-containing protein [Leptothrix sp. (in: Bacteria)]|nr:DUF4810 domain-containing protein [Leptothrix sp. (in: b-proteobacteria)]
MTTRHGCRLPLFAVVALLGACAQKGPGPMYLWETFPRQQYETLLRSGTGAPGEQLLALQAHAEKARATGAALPPGFRAHLGMLKLSGGDAQGAREAWLAEKAAFPESTPYMDQLLKRLESPKKSENPA